MSILAPSSGRNPDHQHLFGRGTTPTKSSQRGRHSSLMLPPENRTTTPRGRNTTINSSRMSRPGRNSSVLSQRKSNSAGKKPRATGKGSTPPAPSIGGCTYVADVNPTFCVEGSIRFAEPINDRVAWTAEYDGSVRIRALPQGSELKQLEGRANTFCTCLLFLEQYQRMWAAFNDGFIRIYESSTAKLLQEVVQHAGGVNCMIEMEGSVYTGGVDWKVGLWNPETSTFERLFFGHSGAVRSLCSFNGPSGCILFSGSDDGTIRAWDPYAPVQTEEDRACLHIFKGHDRGVLCLEALPHLSQLWSGGEDGTVRVWNLQTLEAVKVLKGHTAPVSTLLPVESRMWSGDKHGHIILWDISSLTPLQEISSRMEGGRLGMVLTMKKIQPSSCWKVWTAGSTGFVQCWNAETVPIVFDAKNQYKYGNRGVHEMVLEMESYIQALQDELAAAKDDAGMNYERGRIEVQRELVAHQLLQEENEMLRNKVRQLEAGGGGTGSSLLKDRGGDSQTDFRSDSAELLSRSQASSPRGGDGEVPNPLTSTSGLASMMGSGGGSGPTPAAIFPPGDQYKGKVSSTPHSILVPGDHWDAVAAHRPHQVRDTAKEEVCMALGIPPSQLSKLTVEPVRPRPSPASYASSVDGGVRTPRGHQPQDTITEPALKISCIVAHPAGLRGEEVQRRLEAFNYPRLGQLHSTSEDLPKRGLDAAEERIQALERQLERALDASHHNNQSSTSNSGAAYKDPTADPLDTDAILRDQRQQEEILHQQDQIQELQQTVERLRDENDILRALLDEAADRSRSDGAASSSRRPGLSAKEDQNGSAYAVEEPEETGAQSGLEGERQGEEAGDAAERDQEDIYREMHGISPDTDADPQEPQPPRQDQETAALDEEEERRREEERVYYEYFGRPRPPSDPGHPDSHTAEEEGLYSVSEASEDTTGRERPPNHGHHPHHPQEAQESGGAGGGIMDFLDRTIGEDHGNNDGGIGQNPYHSRPYPTQQQPQQGGGHLHQHAPSGAGGGPLGQGIMDFLNQTVGEDGNAGRRPGERQPPYQSGAAAPPSALKRPIPPGGNNSNGNPGGRDGRGPGQGQPGPGAASIGLPPRGGSGVSASPPRPTSHPEQYLPMEADPETVQQALQAAKDLNEYLKNVISEKERQRVTLQREVDALRQAMEQPPRPDSMSVSRPSGTNALSSSPVVYDEEARRQNAYLRELLRQARHRSETTRNQLEDLLHAVAALRGAGGGGAAPRSPRGQRETSRTRRSPTKQDNTPQKEHPHRHYPYNSYHTSSSSNSHLPVSASDLHTPQADRTNPPHPIDLDRYRYPTNRRQSPLGGKRGSPTTKPAVAAQARRSPGEPAPNSIDYPEISTSTEESSQLPQRVQRDSLHRPPYPSWAAAGRDLFRRGNEDEDSHGDGDGRKRHPMAAAPREREVRRPGPVVRPSRESPRVDTTTTTTISNSSSTVPPSYYQPAREVTRDLKDHRSKPQSQRYDLSEPRHSDEQIAAANAVLAARVRDAEAVANLLREQHRRSAGGR